MDRERLREIVVKVSVIRAMFHIWAFYRSPDRAIIEKDLDRWVKATGAEHLARYSAWKKLTWFLVRFPEFRNLFYHRLRNANILMKLVLKFLFGPMDSLYIYTEDIGPGLFIQHGFSTIISAKSIGADCWINQQVTIGYTNVTDCPVIGDRVTIGAGAKVLGSVTIGDDAIIGANAVVVKNVPPNCVVVGVPAYIIRRDGRKTREEL